MKTILLVFIILLCLTGIMATSLYLLSPPPIKQNIETVETPFGNLPVGQTINLTDDYLMYIGSAHGTIINNVELTDKNTFQVILAESCEFLESTKKNKWNLRFSDVLIRNKDSSEMRIREMIIPIQTFQEK